MLEALALPFILRALVAGVLVSIASSYLGAFVVQRRLGFLGSGLAHATFGGVALGLLLHREPLYVAVPFTIAMAVLITWMRDRTRLSSDTIIGVFFSFAMALGIIFMSLRTTYSTDAFTYLFGSILAISNADLIASGALLLLVFAAPVLWGRWAYATFDREAALADRLPVARDDQILSIAVAVTVVIAVKVVGIVLLSAFLIIPAAAARLVTRKFSRMTVASIIIGATTVVAGILLSYSFDFPSGAMIIVTQTAVFLIATIIAGFAGRASRSGGQPETGDRE